jgi:hypothetical protein
MNLDHNREITNIHTAPLQSDQKENLNKEEI